LPTINVAAGGNTSIEIDVPDETCYIDGPCGYATVSGSAGWISGSGGNGLVTVFVDPPLNTPAGSYSYSVEVCSGFSDPDDESCVSGSGDVEVESASSCGTPQIALSSFSPIKSSVSRAACAATVTLSPSSLAVSTGDTGLTITANIIPNNTPFQVVYSISRMSPAPPGYNCNATLSIPDGVGSGTVTSSVTASQPDCSGVFTLLATASIYSSQNSVTVVVPPQALIRQMVGEAHGFSDQPSLDPNQVAQISVGVAAKNRFNLQEFNYPTSWQQLQGAGQIATSTVSNGPPVVIGNAVAVYTGLVDGTYVGGATCYWSPTTTQFQIIQNQYQTNPNSTTTPSNTGDPGCYTVGGRYPQFVWKVSMPSNTRPDYAGAPAFLFVRNRNASDPAIVQIP